MEVVQFAWRPLAERVRQLGAVPQLRLTSYGQPFVTDEGNYILDCSFTVIENPRVLAAELKAIAGVMEHGLFVHIADTLIVGQGAGTQVITRQEAQRSVQGPSSPGLPAVAEGARFGQQAERCQAAGNDAPLPAAGPG